MIENNLYEFKEKTRFEQKNIYIESYNLENKEINLHDLNSWTGDNKKSICFCEFFKIFDNDLKTIRTYSHSKNDENTINKKAFEDFVKINLNNSEYKNHFVAFVNGKFQGVGDKRNALIGKMYDKFGNVDMYVDKVTDEKEIVIIDTPEFN